MKHSLRIFAFVFAALVSVGCGARSLPFDVSLEPTIAPEASASSELTLASFARRLSDSGASVRVRGEVKQPFFAVNGKLVELEGEPVQVYEYSEAAAARAVADAVTPDGSAIASGDSSVLVDWAATPHFYHRDRLIVVYVGEDSAVLNALDSTLGTPFAGASAYRGMLRTAR
jgi:hypothetical protein